MPRQLTLDRLLKSIDPWTLLTEVLSGEDRIAAQFSVLSAEGYLQGAAMQQARLDRTDRAVKQAFARLAETRRATRQRAMQSFFRDIHFYLTCWNIIGRDLRLIRDVTRLPGVGVALRPHIATFRRYTAIRDHLEHLDERMPGRKKAGTLKRSWDYGQASRNTFSFGGEQIDVSRRSFDQLKGIVDHVMTALKQDAWRQLEKVRPEMARKLIADDDRDGRLRRILRKQRTTQPAT